MDIDGENMAKKQSKTALFQGDCIWLLSSLVPYPNLRLDSIHTSIQTHSVDENHLNGLYIYSSMQILIAGKWIVGMEYSDDFFSTENVRTFQWNQIVGIAKI